MPEIRKRETAYKLKIGDLLLGTPIVEDIPQENPDPNQTITQGTKERFRFLELGDKKIIRVNLIANVIDKYSSEGDKRFSTITIDDASGQIKAKAFGDDVTKIENLSQGDTILVIGVLRSYNQELYISPEIIKKYDPRYLLVRKLELEKSNQLHKQTMPLEPGRKLGTREEIIDLIKNTPDSTGISTSDIILKVKSTSPEVINSEIIKLIEDGMVYEPRPGKVRWLG
jgi:RPA family protein